VAALITLAAAISVLLSKTVAGLGRWPPPAVSRAMQTDAGPDAEPWRPGPAGSAPACGGCEQAKGAGALDGLAAPVGAELRVAKPRS
jgi:hypothetical protein